MSVSPAYLEAVVDRAIEGFPMTLYSYLYLEVLDYVRFLPVKQVAIASRFDVDERTVRRALATLLERRYLERGPVDVTEARTYRLVHSRVQ